jgi:hypothetical protein
MKNKAGRKLTKKAKVLTKKPLVTLWPKERRFDLVERHQSLLHGCQKYLPLRIKRKLTEVLKADGFVFVSVRGKQLVLKGSFMDDSYFWQYCNLSYPSGDYVPSPDYMTPDQLAKEIVQLYDQRKRCGY